MCGERIGWRENTRRVIIFTTDQSFHVACDGKLGGLVEPNDGRCHLDEKGFFSKSTVMDYPSIGQVNALAQKHRASIIWAVTSDQFELYNSLTRLVEGSFAGVISEDSSNIVELVRRQYEMITTTIKVRANSSAECQTKVVAHCNRGQGLSKEEEDKAVGCGDVELGTAVEFTLEVRPLTCERQVVRVHPVGMPDELLVEVDPVCECPCARRDDELTPEGERCLAEECNGHGHPVCGRCRCCGDYYGPGCKCALVSGGSRVPGRDLDESCRPANASDRAPVCSGRGDCVCGQCQCRQFREGIVISGQFCQKVSQQINKCFSNSSEGTNVFIA